MKISIFGGSGFVGTSLCQKLDLKQQDFEIIDLKASNQFPHKSKIVDVKNFNIPRNAVRGDIVVNLTAVHRGDIRDKHEYKRTTIDGAVGSNRGSQR